METMPLRASGKEENGKSAGGQNKAWRAGGGT